MITVPPSTSSPRMKLLCIPTSPLLLWEMEGKALGAWSIIRRTALDSDITEPQPCHKTGGVMRLWQWAHVWVWLVGLRVIETAPSEESVKTLAQGEKSLFIDRADFFDYPDADQARLLAVAQFIGERPVFFDNSGSGAGSFYYITMGFLVVAFIVLLFQLCTHMSCQKGA